MQVVEREKIIPPRAERVVKETVYIASDGEEFFSKSDCELHERFCPNCGADMRKEGTL